MFSPVHEEQQNQSRKVGRGNVGLLLEAEEDEDDDEARNDVVALAGGEKHALLIRHVLEPLWSGNKPRPQTDKPTVEVDHRNSATTKRL